MPYEPLVVTDIRRIDNEVVAGLGALGSSTVHEAYRRRGVLNGIASVVPGLSIAGPAVTCLNYPGDNLMLLAAIEVCQPGDVLVVAVTAPSAHGMLGDLLATACLERGVAGVVLDAGVRDIEDLRRMQLPIFSRGVTSVGTTKAGLGYVNVPVSCGGVVVTPGDVVVGDDDSVVAVEQDAASTVLECGRARAELENQVRDDFRSGTAPLGRGDMRSALEAAGLPQGASSEGGYQ